MNDSEIREKYGLNGKKHGLVLFIQMILVRYPDNPID